MSKLRSKKNMQVLMAATVTAAVVSGCMPTKSKETQAQTEAATAAQTESAQTDAAQEASVLEVNTTDPISIRMNWWGGDSRHQATLEAIKKFEEKYPNITVEAEYESFTGHEEKIALAINSGSAPDLMQMDWIWVENYSPDGTKFYDLNKVSNILDLSNYTDEDKELFTTNGVLQAVPISKTGRVFGWNKKTFDLIGADIPTTLDELLAVGETFKAYDESYYPLVCKELDRAFLMRYYLESKYGKNWMNGNELQYSQEEIADGFDFLKTLEDSHVIPTLEKISGDGADLIDTNQNWIDGHYAGIFLYDTSVVKHAQAITDGELVIGDYIKMGEYQGGITKATQVWGISATTKYPAETAALIQFLMAEEDGVTTLGDTRGIPANKAGLAMLDLSGSQVAEANEKIMDWCKFELDPIFERNSFTGADGTFYLALQMHSYGQADSMEAAKMVMDGIAKEVK